VDDGEKWIQYVYDTGKIGICDWWLFCENKGKVVKNYGGEVFMERL